MRTFLLFSLMALCLSSCGKTIIDHAYQVNTVLVNRLSSDITLKLYRNGKEISRRMGPGGNYTDIQKYLDGPIGPLYTFDSARVVLPNKASKLDVNCKVFMNDTTGMMQHCETDTVSLFAEGRYQESRLGYIITYTYFIGKADAAEAK